MNEGAKTGVFWGLALVLVVLAVVVARPQNEQDTSVAKIIDKGLFESFTDATAAAKLKIVKFNEEQGELSSFEVAKNAQTGAWTIPSAYGYPADATDQMRKAATAFVDTSILDVVSTTPDEHASFGVLEPNVDQREVGDEGVGTLVVIQDSEGNDLVDLIVGDKVPGSDGESYVRKPTQDIVYRVKLSTDSLSTNFVDWIEKDLLKLSSVDVREVRLKDYAVLRTLQGAAMDLEFEADLKVDDAGKWELNQFVTYDERNQPQELKGPPQGKELDATKLNELKNALDDLKIAGVRRKPEGLSADLKADKNFMENKTAMQSMYSRGFYPQPSEDGKGEVFAANGELLVTLREGVQYLLRFGEVEGVGKEGESEAKKEGEDGEKNVDEAEKDPAGLNRYLLVTARVNSDFFPPPELKEVPQTIADLEKILAAEEAATAPKGDEPEMEDPAKETELNKPNAADGAPAKGEEPGKEKPVEPSAKDAQSEDKDPPAADKKDAEPALKEGEPEAKQDGKEENKESSDIKESADKPDVSAEEKPATEAGSVEATGSGSETTSAGGAEAQSDDASPADQPTEVIAKEEVAKEEAAKEEVAKDKGATAESDAAKADDAKDSTESKADEKAPAKAEQKEVGKQLTEEEKKERLEAEQEKITRENQRKIDERKEKIETAQKKARELNARFADWFYVVPESTYRKLRLKQDQLFKAAEPSVPSTGVGTTAP